jgi:tetratricopeptide (TPR) repeat protein
MPGTTAGSVAFWRRTLAYGWYAWGLSLCYWGIYGAEQAFFRAGIRAFSRAIRIWPQFAGAFYRRGLIRGRELSEPQAGIADLTRAIELDPTWPEPYLQRGLFQRFHGDPRAAIADLERYLALGGDPSWRGEAARQIAALQAELADDAEDQKARRGPLS